MDCFVIMYSKSPDIQWFLFKYAVVVGVGVVVVVF